MSGIAGILRFDGKPVDSAILERMLTPMKQRGPHGQSLHMEEKIGLGFTHLNAALQKNGEAISSTRPSRRLPLTFDGRLDNRSELTAKLSLGNSSISDADLILAAYEKWGEDCPKYLLGDFAFALWDRKTNRLFCARDHFGVKPFYYHYSNQYFIFASSPYAILAAHNKLGEINEARIADYLAEFEGFDETSTFYRNVFRLPHGKSLIITHQGMKICSFWKLQAVANDGYTSENDQVDAFRELFSEAVHCRLAAPDQTVVPLSGGMDSTSIASVAREMFLKENDASLISISGLSADINDTETERIRSVISQGGLRSKTFSVDYILQHADELISQLAQADDPFDNLDNTWRALYRQARENKIHVSLDGVDADVLLSGVHHIAVLWHAGKYRELLNETIFADGLTTVYNKHPFNLLLKSLGSILAPEWLRTVRRSVYNHTIISRSVNHNLIKHEFADGIRLIERQRQFASHTILPMTATQIEAHKKSIGHPHLQAALERYDRTAASFSIEPRHPFLDVRLVEFCLGLPWQLKTRRGWTKMILRRAMASSLPEKVVWGKERKHPNWGFSLLLLRARKDYFREILSDEQEILKNYIDINKLDITWNHFLLRDSDEEAAQLWRAIGLAFWLRRQKEFLS